MSPGRRARVAAAAVPGCQHVLGGGSPCQDAARTAAEGDLVLLAVADGHGAAAYPHSAVGSRLAADVAVEVMGALLPQLPVVTSAEVRALIARRIVFEWNRRVRHHAAMLRALDGDAWTEDIDGAWTPEVKPYGTTLVAAAITPRQAVFLRLGDGEALLVDDEGPLRVFSESDKSMGQATLSLSMREGVEHFEIAVLEPPELVVLATDGVADPYDEEPSFEEVWGGDLMDRLRAHGWTQTALGLPRSLGGLARDGDDCTVAIAWFEAEER